MARCVAALRKNYIVIILMSFHVKLRQGMWPSTISNWLKPTLLEGVKKMKSKKEVITEVTSIAKEEKKTNTKIDIPQEEELLQRTAANMFSNLMRLEREFISLSGRGKTRVMNAILAMPTSGIPVKLQTDTEKLCFAIGQRAITDRFIITQYHINQQVRKAKKEQEEKDKTELTKKEETKEKTDDKEEMV